VLTAAGDPRIRGHQIAMLFAAVREAGYVQVFGRRSCETIPALGQPAAEKRQARNRGVWAPRVQRALWGFGAEVSVVEGDPSLSIWWFWVEALASVLAGTSGSQVARQDLWCGHGPVLRTGASGGAAGQEPAIMACVGAVSDRQWRNHGVSILITADAGVGGCFGWQPRAKVSMMTMRPPQQMHGRGSMRGWSAVGASGVSGCAEWAGTASNS
jgi:hypothetical protein